MNDGPCSFKELRRLASLNPPNKEFDCVASSSLTWHCTGNGKDSYECQGGNRHISLFASQPLSLATGNLVTARSKGAVVSASTEGAWNGYYFPASAGILNGPSCWVANKGHSEWYQYSFDTVVDIVEVQT
jgi:hypothetical protein